jgi:hypothetical protein
VEPVKVGTEENLFIVNILDIMEGIFLTTKTVIGNPNNPLTYLKTN